MAENQVDESGSYPEEPETGDELSDPGQGESGSNSEKEDGRVCKDNHVPPLWLDLVLGLCGVAWIISESALPFVAAISPDGRNELRDWIIRTYGPGVGTTATDGGPVSRRRRTRKRKKTEHKEKKKQICNIL